MRPEVLGAFICAFVFVVPLGIIAATTWPVDWSAVGWFIVLVLAVSALTYRRSP